jgi:hypothetical protein
MMKYMDNEDGQGKRAPFPLLRRLVEAQNAIDEYEGEFGGQSLRDEYEQRMQQLQRLGVRAVDPCIAGLSSTEIPVRVEAGRALRRLYDSDGQKIAHSDGALTQRILEALAQAVHDSDQEVRSASGRALLAWDRPRAMEEFVKALGSLPLSAVGSFGEREVYDIVQAVLHREEPMRQMALTQLRQDPSRLTSTLIRRVLGVLAPDISF